MAQTPPTDPLPILLAGGEGARLHELGQAEAKAALPLSGRRLADWAVAAVEAAGLTRLRVVLGPRSDALADHLRDVWGDRLALTFAPAGGTTLASLRAALGPEREALVLPADQIHALDLRALLEARRGSGRPAAVAEGRAVAPVLLTSEALEAVEGDLWDDLLPALDARGALARWAPPDGAYWRDVDTLDDLREAALDLRAGLAGPLPPAAEGPLPEEEPGRAFALEIGGLRLTAPRLGAARPGRWTLVEDSLILPGARVMPGARLSRAVVGPGAVVPANLSVGEDPSEDARWFRVTPHGTTLITAPMLSRRAARLMQERLGDRLAPLARTT